MQRNTIRENIEIFIVTKNSTFRYQLLLWYTEGKRKSTSLHKARKVMAAKLKNTAKYQCCARGSQQRQSKRRKTVTSPLSDTARRLLLVKSKYSAADQQEATAPTIARQQFRFTCVSANAISDTRHGWQPVSTTSCRL